ncbi:MAG: hypothetical protein HYV07_12825 [Deltaproteobacteria bacterium]|nr:hypothetical protein [Deltaproteobacteria bacterium]
MRLHSLPRIPHLPGSRFGNDDLLVPPESLPDFLEKPVVVVEKLDGVGLTIALDLAGQVDVDMKRDWRNALDGRLLRSARRWVRVHEELLQPFVRDGAHLYAEWVLHRLVISYDRLPAAVVFHGIRDRKGRLSPRDESNPRLHQAGFAVVEPHFRGVIASMPIDSLVPKRSRFGRGRAEGVIVEGSGPKGGRWAKWVASHYRQPKGSEVTGEENRIVER